MSVIRLTSGAISLSISSHFPTRGKSMKVKPVILPPGCDRVLTQIPTRVSMLDSDIAVLGPAERLETLAKCNDPSQHFGIVLGVWMQECDAPHPLGLLRPRREWPCSRRAAEQTDELAALHSITSSAMESTPG